MRCYRSKMYGYIFFPCHLSGLPFAKAACHRLNDPRDTPRRDLISSALVLLFSLFHLVRFFFYFSAIRMLQTDGYVTLNETRKRILKRA